MAEHDALWQACGAARVRKQCDALTTTDRNLSPRNTVLPFCEKRSHWDTATGFPHYKDSLKRRGRLGDPVNVL